MEKVCGCFPYDGATTERRRTPVTPKALVAGRVGSAGCVLVILLDYKLLQKNQRSFCKLGPHCRTDASIRGSGPEPEARTSPRLPPACRRAPYRRARDVWICNLDAIRPARGSAMNPVSRFTYREANGAVAGVATPSAASGTRGGAKLQPTDADKIVLGVRVPGRVEPQQSLDPGGGRGYTGNFDNAFPAGGSHDWERRVRS